MFALADQEGALFRPGLHLHAHRLLGDDGGSLGSWRDHLAQAVPGAVAHQDGVRPVPQVHGYLAHGAHNANALARARHHQVSGLAGRNVVDVDDEVGDVLVVGLALSGELLQRGLGRKATAVCREGTASPAPDPGRQSALGSP